MNPVTCCYSCGQATGLNAVIVPCFCTMFWLRKSKCYESFESEKCTVSVASVNRGKMFDGCSCASTWECLSVYGSQIGLVGQRHEKPAGHLKLHFVCLKKYKLFNCCATPNSNILFSMMKEVTEEEYHMSWK